ncbi:hypothetical protein ACFL1G_04500 [Planctomycetota bacterium]
MMNIEMNFMEANRHIGFEYPQDYSAGKMVRKLGCVKCLPDAVKYSPGMCRMCAKRAFL